MWWSRRRAVAASVAVLALATVLGGCGFHLQGVPRLPPAMAVTHIATPDRYSPLYQALVSTLRENDVRLTADPARAGTIIRILNDETGRRLLSVTARNVPAEYEVFYRVRFAVEMDGREVLAPEQLALTRDFSFDETRVLGKAAEEQILRRAIADDLVGLMTRRLAALH